MPRNSAVNNQYKSAVIKRLQKVETKSIEPVFMLNSSKADLSNKNNPSAVRECSYLDFTSLLHVYFKLQKHVINYISIKNKLFTHQALFTHTVYTQLVYISSKVVAGEALWKKWKIWGA